MSADSISLYQTSFRDFDEFSESVVGADLRITLPKLDESRWSISQLVINDFLNIQIGNEGSGSFCEGTTEPSRVTLFFPKRRSISTFNGISMGAGAVFLIQPGSEIHIAEKSPNEWMSISIPNNISPALIQPTNWESCSSGVKMLDWASPFNQALWDLASNYIDMAIQTPCVLTERISVASFRESILHGLTALFDYESDSSYDTRGRKIVADHRIISTALGLINERLDTTISIKDLAQHLGLSERTMRSGFIKYYGVSPSRYIQLRRLDLARKLLQSARKEETTVSEIACQLGMWDFGRFAVRYKRAFGESPSDTLGR